METRRLVQQIGGAAPPGESITLTLKPETATPDHWHVVAPPLVSLEVDRDRRSAVVRPLPDAKLGIGRQTIKVMANKQGVEYFSLAIVEVPDDRPVDDPKSAQSPPPVAEAVTN